MKTIHITIFLTYMFLSASGCAIGTYGERPAPPVETRPAAQLAELRYDLPPIRRADHRGGLPRQPFATYGQCQVELSYTMDATTGLPVVADGYRKKIENCLSMAARERIEVLILPELALAFREPTRKELLDRLRAVAQERGMVIIAGSFYDSNRQSRLPVIGPGWEELGYKIRPSRFEASPKHGLGMKPGQDLLLLDTPFGRIMPLTCVDLISDAVQYIVRNLATRSQVDVVANLNFNPAAWEFLIEGNSLTRRHPIFVSMTNVSGSPDPKKQEECERRGDNGYCFGNSALFANLRDRETDCPNCAKVIADLVEPVFKSGEIRSMPYDTLVAVVPPFQEAMLVYDLNLRLIREPATTNAPDQGYPVVRNVRRIPLSGE